MMAVLMMAFALPNVLNAAPAVASYLVYSVTGEVYVMNKGRKVALSARKTLRSTDVVEIGEESALTLLDEVNSQMIYLTSKGKSQLKSFVNSAKSASKSLTSQYAGYIKKQLLNAGSKKMSHPDTYMQATATSYRSQATDSLLLASIVEMLSAGSEGAENVVCSPQSVIPTNLDVDFDLVRCDDGSAVVKAVKGNTGCYVRVRNNTAEQVYVNVLNIDEKGEKYLVLPVDDASLCAHLLVPPMSAVSFKSEPFIFGEEQSNEAFMLVATKEPVDFSVLMSPIKAEQRSKRLATGLCRKIYEVK